MDSQVVIVGAGPAGALLAYLLSSRGVDTLLLERQLDFDREFRGEILMPSGVRALEAAGFDLDRIATRVPARGEGFMNGRPFLSLALDELPPPRPTVVSQPELLERLIEMSEATGHFEFRRGCTVRGLARLAEGGVELTARGESGHETLRAGYLIGTDGRGSIVRRGLAPRTLIRSTPLDVVWFKLPYPEAWAASQARFEAGRGHLLIVVQSADGLLQTAWVILKGTYGELKNRSVPEWIDAMRPYADPELAEHFARHRDAASRPFLLNAVSDRVVGWAGQDTLLLGDAAHTMSPVGGQGINIALRDVIVAANEIVPAFRSGGDVNAAAARIEGLRAPEVDRIQRLQALPPRLMMGRTPVHELIRRGMAGFLGTRFGQSVAGARAAWFLDGVTDVTLRV